MTSQAVSPVADEPGEQPGAVPAQAWRALAVGAAGLVLFGFNMTATNLAFGSIADSFPDVSETVVSWVASGYFIASAAFLPLGGRLADRVGRRRVFNLGLAGMGLFAAVSALAPTIWILIAARIGQAMAAAAVIPASLAMALPAFPANRRSSAVATWAAAGPLSAALAPSIAAALLEVSDWRWVYALTAPLAAGVLAASFLHVPRSRAEDAPGRLDLLGTVLATAAIAALILGIGQGSTWGWGSVPTVTAVVASFVLGAAFLVRSSRHPTPLLDLSLFRNPEVGFGNLANLLMSTTSLSIWLVWPLWLGRVWDYSTSRIGLAITVGPVFAGLATLIGGRLADRYGQRWLMIIGSAIATAAVLNSVFRFGAEPDYVSEFIPTIAGFGLGWGLSNPSMNSWALSRVPAAVYGEVNATFNTIRNLGGAIGVSAVVAIIGDAGTETGPIRSATLQTFERANLFLAASIGLSCVTVMVGTAILAARHETGDA
ncbi:MAG: MFS transporter [Actinomycetota bacterium]